MNVTKPIVSRLTSKGQATIPVSVRRALNLKPGDRVAFEISGRRVTLRRVDPRDRAFLKLSEPAFSDWLSPEDEEAFRDL